MDRKKILLDTLRFEKLRTDGKLIINSFERFTAGEEKSPKNKKEDEPIFFLYSDAAGVLRFKSIIGGAEEDEKPIKIEFIDIE